jgi:glucokinase
MALQAYPVANHKSFYAALQAYIAATGGPDGCTGAAIGAAGPVSAGKVRLTNLAWEISEEEVSSALGKPCKLVNDVEAAAFAVPYISRKRFSAIGVLSPDPAQMHRAVVANIGTGFGAATLIRNGTVWVSCPGEAGHMSLCFPDWDEPALPRQFPSVEHVLSGRGIANLHAAPSKEPAQLAAPEIFERAGTDPHCAVTLRLFTRIAGNVLGNLVLASAAWDGVFLCGSVARSLAKSADTQLFREAFEGTGPRAEWLGRVPVALLTDENPALAGLAVLPLPASL